VGGGWSGGGDDGLPSLARCGRDGGDRVVATATGQDPAQSAIHSAAANGAAVPGRAMQVVWVVVGVVAAAATGSPRRPAVDAAAAISEPPPNRGWLQSFTRPAKIRAYFGGMLEHDFGSGLLFFHIRGVE
jgi:hypothetical protein